MKHDIYANPNMNDQILINALSKAKLTHMLTNYKTIQQT